LVQGHAQLAEARAAHSYIRKRAKEVDGMTDEEQRDIWAELREPFPAAEVKWRRSKPPSSGPWLAYVDARSVQIWWDKTFGPANWQTRLVDWGDNGVICGIGVKIDGEWVWKWDGADRTQIQSEKGGISDAFKRASVVWGVGRYLYDLPLIESPQPPPLPDWALPEGEKGKPAAKPKPSIDEGSGEIASASKPEPEEVDPLADLKLSISNAQSASDLAQLKPAFREVRAKFGESFYSQLAALAVARHEALQGASGDQG